MVDSLYSPRKETKFKSCNIRTFRYGTETLSFVGYRVSNSIPYEVK